MEAKTSSYKLSKAVGRNDLKITYYVSKIIYLGSGIPSIQPQPAECSYKIEINNMIASVSPILVFFSDNHRSFVEIFVFWNF